MKKIISYLLLLSLLVVLTPRKIWHDCDHHHEVESSQEVHIEKDNCFACDFELGIISQPAFIQLSFEKQSFVNQTIFICSFSKKDKFNQFSHRGPPII